MEYRPRKKLRAASLEAAKRAKPCRKSLQALVYAKDEAGRFAWEITKRALLYSAARSAGDRRRHRGRRQRDEWGFNWELGPFETWDAIGVEKSVARMGEEGETIPAWWRSCSPPARSPSTERKTGKSSPLPHRRAVP